MKSTCRLCDSESKKIITKESHSGLIYTIAKCNNCSLIYILETYNNISPDYVNRNIVNDNLVWLQGTHKIKAYNQLCNLNIINKSFSKLKNILDVGCGTGGWLSYLKDNKIGQNYFGFDASTIQVNYANKKFKNIREAYSIDEYLNKINNQSLNFDLITLWDVLEHIRKPKPFLESLVGKLNVGGIIYVSVPAAFPMRTKNILKHVGYPGFTWHPHEHVIYFSPKTINYLFNKINCLKVVKVGAVKVYNRPLSLFEFFRRVGFKSLENFPSLSPQIFLVAIKE